VLGIRWCWLIFDTRIRENLLEISIIVFASSVIASKTLDLISSCFHRCIERSEFRDNLRYSFRDEEIDFS
jgi:hypothetical protein